MALPNLAWVSPGIVALGGVIVLLAAGKVVPDDLGRISWATLLTFGGGLTLGVFMTESGTSDWLVTRLGDPGSLPSLMAVMAVALVALAVPLAGVMGIDPVLLVMVVAIATSVDFALVIGTPPTMLAYSTELFTAREILRRGAPLDLIGVLLLVLAVIPLWRLFGLI
jgi:sodium-dependent dicarboxylate transporter 2/3/5